MKKIILAIMVAMFAAWGCNKPQMPEFKEILEVETINAAADSIIIQAKVKFYNPNSVGCTVTDSKINLHVNGAKTGRIDAIKNVELPAEKDFILPVKGRFATADLINGGGNIFAGIINAALTGKVQVRYEGTVTVEVLGVNFDVPIDQTKDVTIQ